MRAECMRVIEPGCSHTLEHLERSTCGAPSMGALGRCLLCNSAEGCTHVLRLPGPTNTLTTASLSGMLCISSAPGAAPVPEAASAADTTAGASGPADVVAVATTTSADSGALALLADPAPADVVAVAANSGCLVLSCAPAATAPAPPAECVCCLSFWDSRASSATTSPSALLPITTGCWALPCCAAGCGPGVAGLLLLVVLLATAGVAGAAAGCCVSVRAHAPLHAR